MASKYRPNLFTMKLENKKMQSHKLFTVLCHHTCSPKLNTLLRQLLSFVVGKYLALATQNKNVCLCLPLEK